MDVQFEPAVQALFEQIACESSSATVQVVHGASAGLTRMSLPGRATTAACHFPFSFKRAAVKKPEILDCTESPGLFDAGS